MGAALYKAWSNKIQVQLCDRKTKPDLESKTLVLAIKPQDLENTINDLFKRGYNKELLSKKVIISIMAGVSIEKLKKITGSDKIIRCMPNLPLIVDQGVTGWIATKNVKNHEVYSALFESFGTSIQLKKEEEIDAITALAGSSPAYFFAFCESLEKAALAQGFSPEIAQEIAQKSFIGAAKLLDSSKLSARKWREAVTSKGGTTAAALESFKESGLQESMNNAVNAAIKRAKELSK